MNNDIRVAITCPDHPKIKKLMRRLGDKSFWNLIKLWCFVASNKPSGDISSYDIDDIEIGAGWDGEHGLFFSTLVSLSIIDEEGETVVLHDWEAHNGWASGAEARSEKARKAAKTRWDKKNGCSSNATSTNEQCDTDANSNAPSPNPSPSPKPSPKPSPIPKPKKNKTTHQKIMELKPDFFSVDEWAELYKHRTTKKASQTVRAYNSLIEEFGKAHAAGMSADKILNAMSTGKGWSGFKYEWILNQTKGDAREDGKLGLSAAGQATYDAGQEWIKRRMGEDNVQN